MIGFTDWALDGGWLYLVVGWLAVRALIWWSFNK
jgi:hypothetical protein